MPGGRHVSDGPGGGNESVPPPSGSAVERRSSAPSARNASVVVSLFDGTPSALLANGGRGGSAWPSWSLSTPTAGAMCTTNHSKTMTTPTAIEAHVSGLRITPPPVTVRRGCRRDDPSSPPPFFLTRDPMSRMTARTIYASDAKGARVEKVTPPLWSLRLRRFSSQLAASPSASSIPFGIRRSASLLYLSVAAPTLQMRVQTAEQ